eukprot:3725984-Pleurochrysis_carterae.AAC.1
MAGSREPRTETHAQSHADAREGAEKTRRLPLSPSTQAPLGCFCPHSSLRESCQSVCLQLLGNAAAHACPGPPMRARLSRPCVPAHDSNALYDRHFSMA